MDNVDGVMLIAVITGLLLGQVDVIADYSAKLIVPLLMAMLFGLFLTINVSKLKSAFLNVKFSLTSLIINFIWTPVFAYLLVHFPVQRPTPLDRICHATGHSLYRLVSGIYRNCKRQCTLIHVATSR